jgi:hypothetical protein
MAQGAMQLASLVWSVEGGGGGGGVGEENGD